MVIVFTSRRDCVKEIEYSFSATSYGECLTAWSRGWLCYATFTPYLTREVALHELRKTFPMATFATTKRTFDPTQSRPKRILVVGTPFQCDVWRALLEVPRGKRITYSTLASLASHPTAVRSVATSVGRNPISVVIPCHRIVPASGGIGKYHSGEEIKRLLLASEAR